MDARLPSTQRDYEGGADTYVSQNCGDVLDQAWDLRVLARGSVHKQAERRAYLAGSNCISANGLRTKDKAFNYSDLY